MPKVLPLVLVPSGWLLASDYLYNLWLLIAALWLLDKQLLLPVDRNNLHQQNTVQFLMNHNPSTFWYLSPQAP
jgi:hypothetical protein